VEATVTIEIEPRELIEARPRVVPEHQDVAVAVFDVATPQVVDPDQQVDLIELLPKAHPDEDELSLWFG
jgi:hypothetical protein